MNYVYTTDDPAKYGDTVDDMAKMRLAGLEVHQNGYTKLFDLGTTGEIIPKVMGASATTHKCAYHGAGAKDWNLRTPLIGGGANAGNTGFGEFRSDNICYISSTNAGYRTVNVL